MTEPFVLTADERRRIDRADVSAYERLYAAAASTLGTGSAWRGQMLAMWYPGEREAGYNYLNNLHLATDLDLAFADGLATIRAAGALSIGIPIDERVDHWATPARLAALGLSHESDENIWARRIGPGDAADPEPPTGLTIAREDLAQDHLEAVINRGWDMPPGHNRGRLFAFARQIPEWKWWIARDEGGEVAAVSLLIDDTEAVGYCFLTMVMPEFRGRGLQTYFIRSRLAEAARAGCTLAMTETDDDNASPRNMQRAGFRLAVRRRIYSRSLED